MSNPLMGVMRRNDKQPNVFQSVAQAVKRGADPNQIAQQLIQDNPAVRQAAELMNGKTNDQIKNIAFNRAKEMGVDLNAMAKQWGIKLPD